MDKLQRLGCNKIIALGHSGFEVDQEIAKRVRGVDVVVGGHTNTFLYTGALPTILFRSSGAWNSVTHHKPKVCLRRSAAVHRGASRSLPVYGEV